MGLYAYLQDINTLLDEGRLFRSIIARNSLGAPENVMLFLNGGTKKVKFVYFDLIYNSATFTNWEIYRNPTITTNGTAQATVNANTASLLTATAVLYDAPTISATGTLIRAFATDTNSRQVLNPPVQLVVNANESVLIRRVNTGAGNEIKSNWHWFEY